MQYIVYYLKIIQLLQVKRMTESGLVNHIHIKQPKWFRMFDAGNKVGKGNLDRHLILYRNVIALSFSHCQHSIQNV